jgi:hypothetical protein
MARPVTFGYACILCLLLLLLGDAACHAAPGVQVDDRVYDAGDVIEGKDAVHEFTLRNTGDQELVIRPKPC